MASPIKLLVEKHKLGPDDLKAAFDATTLEKRPLVKKLVEGIRDKIREGVERNRRDYRLYKAMDWAYDQPFYQVSQTQLKGLISSRPDDKKVLETVKQWGLSHLLVDAVNPETGQCCTNPDGSRAKSLNLPVFTNIFVPLVMAYITIRWAKLFNDRNLTPHFKYEPVQYTVENRARCELVTQAVQRMSAWLDYPADTKQTILQTLIYGMCINFPREAWWCEKQLDENGKEYTAREGIRFNMPHPTRVYYDQYQRLSSLNSNSGCKYAGYWELQRFKDVDANPLYWNKDKIAHGATATWFDTGNSDFLQQVYPCAMELPPAATKDTINRESDILYYNQTSNENAATLITQHFEHIIPKDCGLGDYPYSVMFRFVFASDNAVLWAEPIAYDRIPTYTYDADYNRSRFRSMALETTPFQDMIGNVISQWILAVQQNLNNPIFYDKDKIPVEYLRMIQNMGQKAMNGNIFIPFSSTETLRIGAQQKEAFHQPTFARHETSQLSTLLSGIISMLDRIMQLSPQEIGQAASHEQTAEESRIIATNTSTRVEFTGTGIDAGDYAKKVILYDGMMAYADDVVVAGVSSALTNTDEEFKKLMAKIGMEIVDKDKDPTSGDPVRTVKGSKKSLKMPLESFASTRDRADRIDNAAIADAMSKVFIAIAGNEMIVQSLGAPQLVELVNQIIATAGLPKEFKLRGVKVDASKEEQNAEVTQMLTQLSEQVRGAIDQSAQQTLAAAQQQTAQIVEQMVTQAMAAITSQMEPVVEAVAQNSQVNQVQQQEIQALSQAVAQIGTAVQAAVAPPAEMIMAPPESAAPPVGVPVA